MIAALIWLFSCEPSSTASKNAQSGTLPNQPAFPAVNDEFTQYLSNFRKLDLPVNIKACTISTNDFELLEGAMAAKYTDESSLAFGQVSTNGPYIATLTLKPTECYLPVLTTYKLTGELIDKEIIAIGGCGSDCGFSCEEFMTLKKDLTFYTSDTISTFTCDSLGNEVPGTYRYFVTYKKGQLLPTGKIAISEAINKPLEGRKPVQ